MLRPFQIRDLHRSSSQGVEGRSGPSWSRHGVVQVSAADYDQIALNHPRARLTYLDDDDGDQITVGSSLELSQRLDEPADADARLNDLPLYQNEQRPMHIFDIRRTNSVTELWRQFEWHNDGNRPRDMTSSASVKAETALDDHEHRANDASHGSAPTSAAEGQDQSFMEAFETELANFLGSAESSAPRNTRPEPSTPADPSSPGSSSQRTHHPLEVVAATFLYHLMNGASSVQSELRSRLPELQEQLRNAQRTVPDNVRSTLQRLLATIEAHVRTAFQNLPENGMRVAEDAINAGRPVAEHAVDGFRIMASELNEASRTLFAAFENEFSRRTSNGNDTSEGLYARTMQSSSTPARGIIPDASTQDMDCSDSAAQKKDFSNPGHSFAQNPEANLNNLSPINQPPSQNSSDNGQANLFSVPGAHHPPFPFLSGASHPPLLPSHPSNMPLPSLHLQPSFHPPWQQPRGPLHAALYVPPPSPPLPRPGQGTYSNEPYSSQNPWFKTWGHHDRRNAPPTGSPDRVSSQPPETSDLSEKKVMFIGNVGFNVSERMIQDVFASKGFVVSVHLPHDSDTGNHAGFGYVEFPSIHPAMAAIDALQGVHIDGHAINLEFSDDAIVDSLPPSEAPGYNRESTLYDNFPLTAHGLESSRNHQDKLANTQDTSPLIDLTTQDTVSTYESNELKDRLPEINHFPPVSQLDAQLLANQAGRRALDAASQANASQVSERPLISDEPASLLNTSETTQTGEDASETLKAVFQGATSDPVPLMQRARDLHALRRDIHEPSQTNTWARLDKRERRRSRYSTEHPVPGSFPVDVASQPAIPSSLEYNTETLDESVANCVSSLIDMGYGTAEDGGRSRLTIYAAASNGVLYDAIEMIEEERKAYACQARE